MGKVTRVKILVSQVYNRLSEGHFSAASWRQWDSAYSKQFLSEFPPSWWVEARPYVGDDFAVHVDAIYEAETEKRNLARLSGCFWLRSQSVDATPKLLL